MGVFWGAAAIVFMLSFGSGFRAYMVGEMSRYGEGIVFIPSAEPLVENLVSFLKEMWPSEGNRSSS